ncbi:lipase family protein [Pseudomonas purpurea]|uniref:lipase family protein n=1 Tax=Pseudomonas purpurea TaxID=3136737 RepID=UPI003264A698
MTLPYDPGRRALYRPEERPSVFTSPVLNDLQLCTEASRLAYLRFEESTTERTQLADALDLAGFNHKLTHFVDAATDGAGFGVMNNAMGTALLVFRGTQPDHLLDLLTNLQFFHAHWSLGTGQVHRGFKMTAINLWAQVSAWLQGPALSRSRLIICGHSLGAAIATLLAKPASANLLVTLGSPRVGDPDFVASLAGLHSIRIVDCCDLVTSLPPDFLDYQHVGQLHYVDLNGFVHLSPSEPFMTHDQQQAVQFYEAHYKPQPGNVVTRRLADHAPFNYVRALW